MMMAFAMLAFASGCQPIAQSGTQERISPRPEGERTVIEQVIPQKGQDLPAPQLSPEERERLIRGTEVEAPPAPCPNVIPPEKPGK